MKNQRQHLPERCLQNNRHTRITIPRGESLRTCFWNVRRTHVLLGWSHVWDGSTTYWTAAFRPLQLQIYFESILLPFNISKFLLFHEVHNHTLGNTNRRHMENPSTHMVLRIYCFSILENHLCMSFSFLLFLLYGLEDCSHNCFLDPRYSH